MTRTQLHEFARAGAQARLQAISEERAAIIRVFPDLRTRATKGAASVEGASPVAPRARKRRRLSAAERQAVGRRMRAYWAKRRAEKAGAKKATAEAKRKGGMSAEARKRQGERMKAYWATKHMQSAGAAGAAQAKAAAGSQSSSTTTGQKTRRKEGRKK